MAGRGGGWADKLKSSNGKPFGAYEFPETAPLVYPALDYLALKDDEKSQGKRYKLKRSRAFLEDYMDRRAQARFVSLHPHIDGVALLTFASMMRTLVTLSVVRDLSSGRGLPTLALQQPVNLVPPARATDEKIRIKTRTATGTAGTGTMAVP